MRDKLLVFVVEANRDADFGRFQLWGAPAWLAWLGIHIFFLIGFRNRILVIIEWAWQYMTFNRSARLITGPPVATSQPHTEVSIPPDRDRQNATISRLH